MWFWETHTPTVEREGCKKETTPKKTTLCVQAWECVWEKETSYKMHTHPPATLPLLVAPLFSLLPSDEELRLVGNPLTGSLDVLGAAGRPTDHDAGCWLAVDFELDVMGSANADARSAVVRGLGIPGRERKYRTPWISFNNYNHNTEIYFGNIIWSKTVWWTSKSNQTSFIVTYVSWNY